MLHTLVHNGPTMQPDLLQMLQVERRTLSGIVMALVRKGLVLQMPDRSDQRQKRSQLTAAGSALWDDLSDMRNIRELAFEGSDPAEIEITVLVLRRATERFNTHISKGKTR